MAVEILGNGGEVNGYGDSMEAFRNADRMNANALLNHMERKPKNAFRPEYDPRHPDNQWPVMLYHAEHGEKVVGVNLKGLEGFMREDAEKRNKEALKKMLSDEWQYEQFMKPRVAVLDPAIEKAALIARAQHAEGQVVALNHAFIKLEERLNSLEKTKKAKAVD